MCTMGVNPIARKFVILGRIENVSNMKGNNSGLYLNGMLLERD